VSLQEIVMPEQGDSKEPITQFIMPYSMTSYEEISLPLSKHRNMKTYGGMWV
jgi:hypothetical protein